MKGESEMEFDADIGPLVVHKYTVTNKGPWSVSNVTLQVRSVKLNSSHLNQFYFFYFYF